MRKKDKLTTTDPFGDEFYDLCSINKTDKDKLNGWIDEMSKAYIDGFWGKRMSEDKREGYKQALNHLRHELNDAREWI